jgi:acetate kinase
VVSKKSGLLGVSELSNDMRDLREAIKAGNAKARLAVDKFTWTIARGSAAMWPSWRPGHAGLHRRHRRKRHRLARRDLRGLGALGIVLDAKRNNVRGAAVISAETRR